MRWMIRNSSGKKDAVLTLTVIGFLIVVIKLLFAGTAIVIGANTFQIGEIGAAEIGAILTPTLGAYVARRYTDKTSEKKKESEGQEC